MNVQIIDNQSTMLTRGGQNTDSQQVIAVVALNYVLIQKYVNLKNPSLKSSPVYRKALAESVYILDKYIHVPKDIVRNTFNLTNKRWSDMMANVQFQCDHFCWFNDKIFEYAEAISLLTVNHQAKSNEN